MKNSKSKSNIQKSKHKKGSSSISCFSCCSSNPKEPKISTKNQSISKPITNKDGTGPTIRKMNVGDDKNKKRDKSNDSEFLDEDPALGGE